jgi:hypothetical protein
VAQAAAPLTEAAAPLTQPVESVVEAAPAPVGEVVGSLPVGLP